MTDKPLTPRERVEAAITTWDGDPFGDVVDADFAHQLAAELEEANRLREAAERQLAAKTAECERLREDAERYQLLRSRAFLDGDESGPYEPFTFVLMIPAPSQNESFDAAIDAARKETP